MNTVLRDALLECETDVDGALYRLGGNIEVYQRCLVGFVGDSAMNELKAAIESNSWDDAFTAAHALKGISGNLGLVPVFHSVARMVVLIREGKTEEASKFLVEVEEAYEQICKTIKQNIMAT